MTKVRGNRLGLPDTAKRIYCGHTTDGHTIDPLYPCPTFVAQILVVLFYTPRLHERPRARPRMTPARLIAFVHTFFISPNKTEFRLSLFLHFFLYFFFSSSVLKIVLRCWSSSRLQAGGLFTSAKFSVCAHHCCLAFSASLRMLETHKHKSLTGFPCQMPIG